MTEDRYYLTQNELGLWSVHDPLTDTPVVVKGYLLTGLNKRDAEDWRGGLEAENTMILTRINMCFARRENP